MSEEKEFETDCTTPTVQCEPVTVAPVPVAPIPNGGFNAWLQVFGAHLLMFNTWYVRNVHYLKSLAF
jgi:hypothetical protein